MCSLLRWPSVVYLSSILKVTTITTFPPCSNLFFYLNFHIYTVFSFSFFLCQWTVNGLTGVALEVVQQLAEEVSGTDVGNVTILYRLMEAKSVQEHLSNQLAAMYKLVQVNFLKVFRIKIQKTGSSIIGDDNDDHKVINSVDIDYRNKKISNIFFNFQDFTSYHESPDILKFVRLAINVQLWTVYETLTTKGKRNVFKNLLQNYLLNNVLPTTTLFQQRKSYRRL